MSENADDYLYPRGLDVEYAHAPCRICDRRFTPRTIFAGLPEYLVEAADGTRQWVSEADIVPLGTEDDTLTGASEDLQG